LNDLECFDKNRTNSRGTGGDVSTIATWGDYEVHFDGLLGRGGMGSVYRAWQRSVGRWVAVKVLENARTIDPDLQKGFLQKFQIEIQALARLNDPRIVTLLQAGENEGRLWFAMELIDGETVEKRLTEKGASRKRRPPASASRSRARSTPSGTSAPTSRSPSTPPGRSRSRTGTKPSAP
jgi:serine/threonine protein kinase